VFAGDAETEPNTDVRAQDPQLMSVDFRYVVVAALRTGGAGMDGV
jgi:hypothetical protein